MSNTFSKPIGELVVNRHSVRNYISSPIAPTDKSRLEVCIKEVPKNTGPFGTKIRIHLIDANQPGQEIKLGTYGVVKGAPHFLAVVCENSPNGRRDLGFLFEKVVLSCTAMGLGTVWLGGTFQKGRFKEAVRLAENEILPIVCPVGYKGGKSSFLGKIIGSGNKGRKDFETLFFNESFQSPLSKAQAGAYGEALELMRLAPSSVNSQPWRVLYQDNAYHFYAMIKNDMNQTDIGIGLCHFYYAAKELGLSGEIKILEKQGEGNLQYIVSYLPS